MSAPRLALTELPELRCPAHGTLVLDLARGRLGDARSWQAEQARRACPECREWWTANLSLPRVDEGVADAVAAFAAPRRAPVAPTASGTARAPWLRLAAGLALLVGGSLAWTVYQDRAELAPAQGPAGGGALFEDGFEDGVESGELAAWSVRAGAAEGEPFFLAGLESGDLSEWSGAEAGSAEAQGAAGADPRPAARPDSDVRQRQIRQRQNSQG